MLIRRLAITALAVLIPASGAAAQASASWPTRGWSTAAPREVGLNAAVLDSIDAEVKAGNYGYVDRILVIRRGRVAFDRRYQHDYDKAYADSVRVRGNLNAHDPTSPYNYWAAWWHPYYQRGDLHTLQSVTKTITSVIIGTAITRGEFPSIDTPALSFFDTTNIKNLDDRKRRMTIRHLLTMTDGMDWLENSFSDPRNTTAQMEAAYDWIAYTLDRPMAADPGTRWNYNSGASQLLAHIFRRATGTDIEEYAARHLFAPLGIQRWYWKRTPAGLIDTEGGLYLEARDLAKIWYLYMKDGMWDGRRVVSPEWVRSSVTPAIAVSAAANAPKYGFKWWLLPDPRDPNRYIWSGNGFGGQFPMAFPNDDLIIVLNAWNVMPGRGMPRARVVQRILAGMSDR